MSGKLEQRAEQLTNPRMIRFVQFLTVGAVGMVIDLSITTTALGTVHYILANALGWSVAVSSNFLGNWWITFDRPDGSLGRQYVEYVSIHAATFGLRVGVIVALVEIVGAPILVATLVGVGTAAVANYLGAEQILTADRHWRTRAVEGINRVANVVYGSRVRSWLVWSGLYNAVFRVYAAALHWSHGERTREVEIGPASAELLTEYPTETVSVLHSLEKEERVLEQFLQDLEPDDVVLDAGANVGIVSCLAGDVADHVVAVEPHHPTAVRLRQNLDQNGVSHSVHQAALGAEAGEVCLAIQNDRPGTQRPSVGGEGGRRVPLRRADTLAVPTVAKIDVEGHEQAVLEGLAEAREQSLRLVYVEAHSQADAAELRRMLIDDGFRVSTICEEGEQVYLRAERQR